MLGAFCATTVPDVHPYVLMNYAGERRSVLTLAHELGHGLHGSLAQDLGLLNARTPLTLAETASVFGEALTFEKLMEREDDPRALLDLLVGRIDDTVATVFRQIAINRFEHAIHTGRREEGELTDRADLRALERRAAPDARRRRRGHRQLRDLVELRAALHPGAGLRLRVLVRLPLLARDLPALPRGGRLARGAVLRPPARGRLGAAGGARVAARVRHRRPRRSGRPGSTRSASSSTRPSSSPPSSTTTSNRLFLLLGRRGDGAGARSGRGRADARSAGSGRSRPPSATARALAEERPSAVLHVGIAGARGLEPLTLVLGSEAVYCDAAGPLVPARALPDGGLVARLQAAFPDARVRPIGTSARVGGSHGVDVEAMEGFAVLRACELAGVPAVEVRVVSNEIDEPDRARWQLRRGVRRAGEMTPRLVAVASAA